MAIGAYLWFLKYDGTLLDSESQVGVPKQPKPPEITFPPNDNIFEIEGYSFDVAQSLNVGSQSASAGAGKVTSTRSASHARPIGRLRCFSRWLVPERHSSRLCSYSRSH